MTLGSGLTFQIVLHGSSSSSMVPTGLVAKWLNLSGMVEINHPDFRNFFSPLWFPISSGIRRGSWIPSQ